MAKDLRISMEKEYRIGTPSFEKFAKIQNEIKNSGATEIVVDCTQTTYISPAFATLLGSLPHYGDFYNKKVKIAYNKEKGKRYISDIGIDKYYNKTSSKFINAKAVPFSSLDWREYEKNRMEGVDDILSQLHIDLSEDERGMLISVIGEIFNNAKDHSGFQSNPNTRVYYCGYWHSKKDMYIVTIYDTGVGVAKNVSEYLGENKTDSEALEWAFGDGNSTQNTEKIDFTRGIGLNNLEKFIKANNGTLYVGSGNAICVIKEGNKGIKTMSDSLRGTVYVFAIRVGEKYKFVI